MSRADYGRRAGADYGNGGTKRSHYAARRKPRPTALPATPTLGPARVYGNTPSVFQRTPPLTGYRLVDDSPRRERSW